METHSQEPQPPDPQPPQAPQEAPGSQVQPASNDAADHGATGNGAGSAMARLISQEKSRIVPGSAVDPADGSS